MENKIDRQIQSRSFNAKMQIYIVPMNYFNSQYPCEVLEQIL